MFGIKTAMGICPNCKNEIEVDAGKDAIICPCCGEPVSSKKAITNYLKKYGGAKLTELAKATKETGKVVGKKANKYISDLTSQTVKPVAKDSKFTAYDVFDDVEETVDEIVVEAIQDLPEEATDYAFGYVEEPTTKGKKNKTNKSSKVTKPKRSLKKLILIIIACLLGLAVIGMLATPETEDNRIAMPFSSSDAVKLSYTDVEQQLKSAGFTNIELDPQYDIILGFLYKEGEVGSVKVNDSSSFSSGAKYDKDVKIVITYHLLSSDDPANKKDENTGGSKPTEQGDSNNSQGSTDKATYPVLDNVTYSSLLSAVKDVDSSVKVEYDYDFMSGTKTCDFTCKDFQVSLVYVASSKKVLSFDIYANKTAGNDAIVSIVKNCGLACANDATNWVKVHMVKPATTEISDVSFEIIEHTLQKGVGILHVNELALNDWMLKEDSDNSSSTSNGSTNSNDDVSVTEAQAITITRKYAETVCPFGIKFHIVSGYTETTQLNDGSWRLSIPVDVTNAYGATYKATVKSLVSKYGLLLEFEIV